MKKHQLVLLSLLSGLLLAVGWFPNGVFPFLFVAFIPLLAVENEFYLNEKLKPRFLFVCAYLAFFLWNILTTWWVKNASFGGAALAIFCNALLMSIPFILFHRIKNRIGANWGYVLFICFWLSFEFIHSNWELSWSWLTLGNAFADAPSIIQWYEYTGVFGGSLWILIVNVLIYEAIKAYKNRTRSARVRNALIISAFIVIPVLLSFAVGKFADKYSKGGISVVAVQPNIDPYNEKFDAPFEEQLQKMLELAASKVDQNTDYVLFPETALTENIWESQLEQSGSIQMLRMFLKDYPKLKIVIGASTGKVYEPGEELSVTARKFTQEEGYYDSYNTALQVDNKRPIQVYHKSKLVPGVEQMPFPFIFKHLESVAIDLGGTTGGLGIQEERSVFVSDDQLMKTAPVVCYESVYGEYVSEYVRNGANFISIITNDGWWGDTPGYKQHLKYGRLRAIETRRWIARSANTGVSCFISPSGEIHQPTAYWEPAVISQEIQLNNEWTFYTRFGDYIARAALCLSIAMLLYATILRLRKVRY
ncbi:MAG: lnt [Bacteroidota bacterium]|jgi:apolipoprotein N-acyltransferase|nr:lnt [Bacteroidota bacterium]